MLPFMILVCFLYVQMCAFTELKQDLFAKALTYIESNPETLEGEPTLSAF